MESDGEVAGMTRDNRWWVDHDDVDESFFPVGI